MIMHDCCMYCDVTGQLGGAVGQPDVSVAVSVLQLCRPQRPLRSAESFARGERHVLPLAASLRHGSTHNHTYLSATYLLC